MKPQQIKLLLTLFGAIALFIHWLVPKLKFDLPSLFFIVIMIVPWLSQVLESVEVAGVKLNLKALQEAEHQAEMAGLLAPAPKREQYQYPFQSVAKEDPNLALAGLRIEIERRLHHLAEVQGIDTSRCRSISSLMKALVKESILTTNQYRVLTDMVDLLNKAVHGAEINSKAAEWAIDVGPRLLLSLNESGTLKL